MHPLRRSQPAQGTRGFFHRIEGLGELGLHAFAQRREPDAFGVAFEQHGTVLGLECLDQRGDGTRADFQLVGRTGKAPSRAEASKARNALSCRVWRVGACNGMV